MIQPIRTCQLISSPQFLASASPKKITPPLRHVPPRAAAVHPAGARRAGALLRRRRNSRRKRPGAAGAARRDRRTQGDHRDAEAQGGAQGAQGRDT